MRHRSLPTVICLFITLLVGVAVSLARQDPPQQDVIAPLFNYNYRCWSDTGGPTLLFQFAHYPFGMANLFINNAPLSSDLTAPTITSIVYSNTQNSLLTNAVRIQAAANGVPMTINASDDVGIVSASLFVDGNVVTTTNAVEGKKLPMPFYLRWNAGSDLSLGAHAFRLVLCDRAPNCTQQAWTMIR